MGTCILCRVRRAEMPLRAEVLDLNLTSIEELCYFLENDPELLDEKFFGSVLTDWLRTELGLPDLADRIEENLRSGCGLADLVFPIMDEIFWLDSDRRQKLERQLAGMEKQPAVVRQKQRGDALAGRGKYLPAIEIYQKILADAGSAGLGSQFTGSICNNLGVIYARLFQTEEAVSCLKKAYELLHTKGALKNYLFCTRMQGGEDAYEKLAAKIGVDPSTKKEMDAEIAALPAPERPADPEAALEEWVRAYRRGTGL